MVGSGESTWRYVQWEDQRGVFLYSSYDIAISAFSEVMLDFSYYGPLKNLVAWQY